MDFFFEFHEDQNCSKRPKSLEKIIEKESLLILIKLNEFMANFTSIICIEIKPNDDLNSNHEIVPRL